MRICLLADANSIHTRKWVEYFSEYENEVHIISMRNTDYHYNDKVKIHIIKPKFNNKLSYLLLISQVKNLVKKINPDILHSHYATSYGLFGRMSNYHPFVISVWGSDVYEFPKQNKLNKSLLKFILNGADAICSTSEDMALETSKYCNKEILITPFGVDLNRFYSQKEIFKNENVTIGIVKGLEKIYGVDYLIKAFAELKKEWTLEELNLHIVGSGTQGNNLIALCKELNISSNVKFFGAIDNEDVPNYINEMDIICIPSLSESFGVSAVEACACSRPVVSTNVGGLKEIIFDNINGYVVESKNSDEIKNSVKKMLLDKNKTIEMAKKGREIIEEKYNWNTNAMKMQHLYEKLRLNRGGK